jgi:DnaJ homolog subfamily C member 19
MNNSLQGRAGLVAFRRYRGVGGVNALGRPFYKGGFEPHMNKREATLILELSYVTYLSLEMGPAG